MELCLQCGKFVADGASATNGFTMCWDCYAVLTDLEMNSSMRQLKFEPADFIVDNIFLGSEHAATKLEYLRENKIGHVLIAAKRCRAHFQDPPSSIKYMVLEDLDDDPAEDIKSRFQAAIGFIKEGRPGRSGCGSTPGGSGGGNVLVHCVSGISRSASMVIAYLVAEKRMRYDEALAYTKARRGCVHPNSGFQRQLRELEAEVFAPAARRAEGSV